MTIQFKVLDDSAYGEALREFSTKVGHSEIVSSWLLKGLHSRSPNFRMAAEFHGSTITGLIATCTLGYLLLSQELLPVWLGIRLDRVRTGTVPRFAEFMHNTSSLISDYYESRGYFQHYIVRKLPSDSYSEEKIAKITRAAWAQGPYVPVVERIVRTEEDYESLPYVFKAMMGRFRPSVIMSMNMPNQQRLTRGDTVRTCITYETKETSRAQRLA